jgi:hypothetical protein
MMMIAAVSVPARKDCVLSENRHISSIRNGPQERHNFGARSLHRDSSILQASLVSRDNEKVLETQKIPL